MAIVEGSTYLASAYVVGGTFYDWEGGWWLAIAWFVIGQLLLIALGLLFRGFARKTSEALDRHNTAVGFSLGGFLLAGGIVSGAVISGPSKGWQHDLVAVGIYLSCWLILMVLVHFITELFTFRSSRLSTEIAEQGNIAAALFKVAIFLSTTLAYVHG